MTLANQWSAAAILGAGLGGPLLLASTHLGPPGLTLGQSLALTLLVQLAILATLHPVSCEVRQRLRAWAGPSLLAGLAAYVVLVWAFTVSAPFGDRVHAVGFVPGNVGRLYPPGTDLAKKLPDHEWMISEMWEPWSVRVVEVGLFSAWMALVTAAATVALTMRLRTNVGDDADLRLTPEREVAHERGRGDDQRAGLAGIERRGGSYRPHEGSDVVDHRRLPDRAAAPSPQPVQIFFSYSTAADDAPYVERLKTHLAVHERAGVIDVWGDWRIQHGHDWRQVIDDHLAAADIVLLNISANYLASEACQGEMNAALKRRATGHTTVIPIIVRPCNWQAVAAVEPLQVLPERARAISEWPDADEACRRVTVAVMVCVSTANSQL